MSRPVGIAQGLHMEKKVGSVERDVQSLISIVKDHAKHIRELFQSSNEGVSKAELLAAMTSANRQNKMMGGAGGANAEQLMSRILTLEKEKAQMQNDHKELTGELKQDIRKLRQALYEVEDRMAEMNTYSALKTSLVGNRIVDATSLQAITHSPEKPASPASPSATFRRKKQELLEGEDSNEGVVQRAAGGMSMPPVKQAVSPVKLSMPTKSDLAPVVPVEKQKVVPSSSSSSGAPPVDPSADVPSSGNRRPVKKRQQPIPEGQTRMGARLAEEKEGGGGGGGSAPAIGGERRALSIEVPDATIQGYNGPSQVALPQQQEDQNVDIMLMSMVLDQKISSIEAALNASAVRIDSVTDKANALDFHAEIAAMQERLKALESITRTATREDNGGGPTAEAVAAQGIHLKELDEREIGHWKEVSAFMEQCEKEGVLGGAKGATVGHSEHSWKLLEEAMAQRMRDEEARTSAEKMRRALRGAEKGNKSSQEEFEAREKGLIREIEKYKGMYESLVQEMKQIQRDFLRFTPLSAQSEDSAREIKNLKREVYNLRKAVQGQLKTSKVPTAEVTIPEAPQTNLSEHGGGFRNFGDGGLTKSGPTRPKTSGGTGPAAKVSQSLQGSRFDQIKAAEIEARIQQELDLQGESGDVPVRFMLGSKATEMVPGGEWASAPGRRLKKAKSKAKQAKERQMWLDEYNSIASGRPMTGGSQDEEFSEITSNHLSDADEDGDESAYASIPSLNRQDVAKPPTGAAPSSRRPGSKEGGPSSLAVRDVNPWAGDDKILYQIPNFGTTGH